MKFSTNTWLGARDGNGAGSGWISADFESNGFEFGDDSSPAD